MAKWFKAEVCKTSIRRFESARRLHIATQPEEAPEKRKFHRGFFAFDSSIGSNVNRFGKLWMSLIRPDSIESYTPRIPKSLVNLDTAIYANLVSLGYHVHKESSP